MDTFTTCSLQTIHRLDATLEEDESYHFLMEYYRQKFLHYIYRFPVLSYEDISNLVNNFTFFCAKVRDLKNDYVYSSNLPVGIFRYVLLEDLTWSPYYTVRRKPGYIVEGAYWSNGMFYQVRQDAKDEFQVYEVVLMMDAYTRKMYSFPEVDSRFIGDPFKLNSELDDRS